MTDNNHTDQDSTDKALGELLTAAGPRTEPSESAAGRVKAAVHAEWQANVKRPTHNRNWLVGSLAAAVTTIFLAANIWQDLLITTPPRELASVEVLKGTVYRIEDGENFPIADGESLDAGTELLVEEGGGIALALLSGQSLRLNQNTRILLSWDNEISMTTGSLYIDSPSDDPDVYVSVETPFGSARDIGTQFAVSVLPDAMVVMVREGLVETRQKSSTETHSVSVGEQLQVHQDGVVSREEIDIYGEHWDWLSDLTPMYDSSEQTLADFLVWICRENGWTLRYTSKVIELNAQSEKLSGFQNTQSMSAQQALEAVFSGAFTTKNYEVRAGVLIVGEEE
ncbi:MAG: FecR family protein [Pseudomonadota bacterium]